MMIKTMSKNAFGPAIKRKIRQISNKHLSYANPNFPGQK